MKFVYPGYFVFPAAALSVAGCCCGGNEAAERPNVILIMTDDHTSQAMGCYGGIIDTPNLDRIAKEGIRMDRCFVPNAISGPSRACILTGKYSHVNGFTDNSKTFDGSQQTLPKLLREAGYSTAMIGKWHLNSAPQGFDFWSILKGQGEYYSPLFIENGKEKTEKGYVTDIITEKAIRFLSRRPKDKPFLLLCYHKAPHRNWMPAQRHLGLYDATVFPEPDNLLDDYQGRGRAAREQEMSIGRDMWPEWDLKLMGPEELGRPAGTLHDSGDSNADDVARANDRLQSIIQYQEAFNRMTPREKRRWNAAYAPRIEEYRNISDTASMAFLTRWKYQQYMKDYCAVVRGVDESVGRLLEALETRGELDNTIVIYTSDQGFFLGEHGWFDKRFMYEECFRTPLLVRYPKSVKRGTTSEALAMNIDLAPTILDYAGVEVPSDIQGRSLRPVLDGGGLTPGDWRREVYYHYCEYPSWHSVKRHYGIRTEKYKLIHFYNDIDEWELYDMERDPREMSDVYGDPSYSAVAADMHRRLDSLIVAVGDTVARRENKR